jgi:hypothetical protein
MQNEQNSQHKKATNDFEFKSKIGIHEEGWVFNPVHSVSHNPPS